MRAGPGWHFLVVGARRAVRWRTRRRRRRRVAQEGAMPTRRLQAAGGDGGGGWALRVRGDETGLASGRIGDPQLDAAGGKGAIAYTSTCARCGGAGRFRRAGYLSSLRCDCSIRRSNLLAPGAGRAQKGRRRDASGAARGFRLFRQKLGSSTVGTRARRAKAFARLQYESAELRCRVRRAGNDWPALVGERAGSWRSRRRSCKGAGTGNDVE